MSPAGMRDVITATRYGTARPTVVKVECQRRIHWNRRMQAGRGLPCAVAHSAHELAGAASRHERYARAVAADDVAFLVEPAHADLQALDRRVDITHRAADSALLAEHVPRLERLAELDLDGAEAHGAVARKAELEVRREPAYVELVTRAVHVADDIDEVAPNVKRQHEFVVELRAPAHEVVGVRLAPETRDQRQQ